MPKSKKRSNEELLLWLKVHKNHRYCEIPSGIRFAIETNFGSLKKARELAGILITDYRKCPRKSKKNNKNAGRPEVLTKDFIIEKIIELAAKLGSPPRMKEINEKSCGFSAKTVSAKFGSYNEALLQCGLFPSFSSHEFSKLRRDVITALINIKIQTNNVPKYINIKHKEDMEYIPAFYYNDKWEDVKLTRSEIEKNIASLTKIKQKCNNYIIYYLVDDSLFDIVNGDIKIINIMDIISEIDDKNIIAYIKGLRDRYDEISRKYVKF